MKSPREYIIEKILKIDILGKYDDYDKDSLEDLVILLQALERNVI